MPKYIYNEGRVVGESSYSLYLKNHRAINPNIAPATERQWLASTLGSGSSLLLKFPIMEADESGLIVKQFPLPTNSILVAASTIVGSFFNGEGADEVDGFSKKVISYGDLIPNNTTTAPPITATTTDAVLNNVKYKLPSELGAGLSDDTIARLKNYAKIIDGVVVQPGNWSASPNQPPQMDLVMNPAERPVLRFLIKGSIDKEFWVLLTGFTINTVVIGESGIQGGSTDTPSPQNGDFLGPWQFPWANKIIMTLPNAAASYVLSGGANYSRNLPFSASEKTVEDGVIVDMENSNIDNYYNSVNPSVPNTDFKPTKISSSNGNVDVLTVFSRDANQPDALYANKVLNTDLNQVKKLLPVDTIAPNTIKLFKPTDEGSDAIALQKAKAYENTTPKNYGIALNKDGQSLDSNGLAIFGTLLKNLHNQVEIKSGGYIKTSITYDQYQDIINNGGYVDDNYDLRDINGNLPIDPTNAGSVVSGTQLEGKGIKVDNYGNKSDTTVDTISMRNSSGSYYNLYPSLDRNYYLPKYFAMDDGAISMGDILGAYYNERRLQVVPTPLATLNRDLNIKSLYYISGLKQPQGITGQKYALRCVQDNNYALKMIADDNMEVYIMPIIFAPYGTKYNLFTNFRLNAIVLLDNSTHIITQLFEVSLGAIGGGSVDLTGIQVKPSSQAKFPDGSVVPVGVYDGPDPNNPGHYLTGRTLTTTYGKIPESQPMSYYADFQLGTHSVYDTEKTANWLFNIVYMPQDSSHTISDLIMTKGMYCAELFENKYFGNTTIHLQIPMQNACHTYPNGAFGGAIHPYVGPECVSIVIGTSKSHKTPFISRVYITRGVNSDFFKQGDKIIRSTFAPSFETTTALVTYRCAFLEDFTPSPKFSDLSTGAFVHPMNYSTPFDITDNPATTHPLPEYGNGKLPDPNESGLVATLDFSKHPTKVYVEFTAKFQSTQKVKYGLMKVPNGPITYYDVYYASYELDDGDCDKTNPNSIYWMVRSFVQRVGVSWPQNDSVIIYSDLGYSMVALSFDFVNKKSVVWAPSPSMVNQTPWLDQVAHG